jgi:FKBP-type peptidyl-prolyl cis-trans isomerase (trigger factor)
MNNKYERKDIDKSTIELTVTIPSDNFEKSYKAIVKETMKDTDIKGFRKGQVPETMIDDHTKQHLRLDTLDKLAPFYINNALMTEQLSPIAPPEYVELPKIDEGKDVEIKLKITIMPEFTLGNMKKVKVEQEEAKVNPKDIETAIEDLKKSQETKEKEVNDAWAKEVAKKLELEEIDTLKDLKDHIKKALKMQQDHMLEHKAQEVALKEAIKISNIEIPEAAINFEAEEREKSFNSEMTQRGVKVEDFIKANNTTIEEMRELWKQDAKDAIETDVFLSLFMKDRDIKVTDEDVDVKIKSILATAPEGMDMSVYDNPEWKDYIKRVEEKERTFEAFLKEIGLWHDEKDREEVK